MINVTTRYTNGENLRKYIRSQVITGPFREVVMSISVIVLSDTDLFQNRFPLFEIQCKK